MDIAVGERLRFLRKVKGVSQQALAEAVGVSFQQVQKYERGANRISASMMVRVAGKLGITPGQLFNDDLSQAGLPEAVGLLNQAGAMELLRAFSALSRSQRRSVLNLVEAMIEDGT